MTNYFRNMAGDQLTGLNLILGSYSVHLLECEGTLMSKILKTLNEYSQQTTNPYHDIWILHQTEDVIQYIINILGAKQNLFYLDVQECHSEWVHERSQELALV